MSTPEQGFDNSYLKMRRGFKAPLRLLGVAVAVQVGFYFELARPMVIDADNVRGARENCERCALWNPDKYVVDRNMLIRLPDDTYSAWRKNFYINAVEYYLFYAPRSLVGGLGIYAILGAAGAILGPTIGFRLKDRFFLTFEEQVDKQTLEDERARWKAQLKKTTAVNEQRKALENRLNREARNNLEVAQKVLGALDVRDRLAEFRKEIWQGLGHLDTIQGSFKTYGDGTIDYSWPGMSLGFDHCTWRRESSGGGVITRKVSLSDFAGYHTHGVAGERTGGGLNIGFFDSGKAYVEVTEEVPFKSWLEVDKKMRSYIQVTANREAVTVSHTHDDTQSKLTKTIEIYLGKGIVAVKRNLAQGLLKIAHHQIDNKLLPIDLKEREDRQKASL